MKKTVLFILILLPALTFGQKTYNVVSMYYFSSPQSSIGSVHARIKGQITVTDSTFSVNMKGQNTNYKIVKKIDSNYFQVSDGLKESIVRIQQNQKTKLFDNIVFEFDKGTVVYGLRQE